MGKDGGFLTPKAIAKRIKAKGLQKLKWYCQVCEKQCRDENGFKCHCRTEAHQRQMLVFSENAGSIMESYSKQFEKGFLDILARKHTTTKVAANYVYNEYIADKEHTRMNATMWTTLTAFVIYLGKTGKCKVEETERGWYIQYIDRDPKAMARQAAREKAAQSELDDEQRLNKQIEKQRQAALRIEKERGNQVEGDQSVSHELIRGNGASSELVQPVPLAESAQKIGSNPLKRKRKIVVVQQQTPQQVNLESQSGETKQTANTTSTESLAQSTSNASKSHTNINHAIDSSGGKRTASSAAIDEANNTWLSCGIVVKVTSKSFQNGEFTKCKLAVSFVAPNGTANGVVVSKQGKGEQVSGFTAKHVESVIPAVGKQVMMLRGPFRGEIATLLDVVVDKYCVTVELASGPAKGRTLTGIAYEDVSKVHV